MMLMMNMELLFRRRIGHEGLKLDVFLEVTQRHWGLNRLVSLSILVASTHSTTSLTGDERYKR